MFYQIFLSPQVKRFAIIIYKDGLYELLHELPNNLAFRKLRSTIPGNQQTLRKSPNPVERQPRAHCPRQNENQQDTSKKSLKMEITIRRQPAASHENQSYSQIPLANCSPQNCFRYLLCNTATQSQYNSRQQTDFAIPSAGSVHNDSKSILRFGNLLLRN